MDTRKIEVLLKQVQAILGDEKEYKNLLAQRESSAQGLLDLLQSLSGYPDIDRRSRSNILKTMLRLSDRSKMFPKCLSIRNVKTLGRYAVATGGYGEVWKGNIGESEHTVCLKIVRLFQESDVENLVREFLREAIIWRQLDHPNLLPFLGLHFLDDTRISLTSPWMENGNLCQYLKAKPRAEVNRHLLVLDVANGLAHLHNNKIVHADLKGVNVLITPEGRACVSDFGMSRIAESEELWKMTSSLSSVKGTIRWMAPELFRATSATYASDVYAFACVCYEIYTGLLPFHHIRSDGPVILSVMQDVRPSRPNNAPELSDGMWSIMEISWAAEPSNRPTCEELLQALSNLTEHASNAASAAAAHWDRTLTASIWTNLEQVDVSPEVDGFLSQCLERIQTRVHPSEGAVRVEDGHSLKAKCCFHLGFIPIIKFSPELGYDEDITHHSLVFARQVYYTVQPGSTGVAVAPEYPGDVFGSVIVLVFDDCLAIIRLREDGTYCACDPPIPLRFLTLTFPPLSVHEPNQPFRVKTTGRAGREYTFYAKTEEERLMWKEVLQKQVLQCNAQEKFCVRSITVPIQGQNGPPFKSIGCTCRSKGSFNGFGDCGPLIAVCDHRGVWLGIGESPGEFRYVVEVENVTQCDFIEESGVFLFLANRRFYVYDSATLIDAGTWYRRYLAREEQSFGEGHVEFFRVGKYMGRTILALYTGEGKHKRRASLKLSGESESIVDLLELVPNNDPDGRSPRSWFRPFRGKGWSGAVVVADRVTNVLFLENTQVVIISPNEIRVCSPHGHLYSERRYPTLHIFNYKPRPASAYPLRVVNCNEDEYLVCFKKFGIYVDKGTWKPTPIDAYIEWEQEIEQVAIHAPFILLLGGQGIEIRHIGSGRLEQLISGENLSFAGSPCQELENGERLAGQASIRAVQNGVPPFSFALEPVSDLPGLSE